MYTRQEKKEAFEKHKRLVPYVFFHKLNKTIQFCNRFDYEREEIFQEGYLALLIAIDRWTNEKYDFDSQPFCGYAIKYIKWSMIKYNSSRTTIKVTSNDWKKGRENVQKFVHCSSSLDEIFSIDANGDENTLMSFFGQEDNYDNIFYAELDSFIKLMPKDIRALMRYYYQACIVYEDNTQAILATSEIFGISSQKLKAISEKWNPELYVFLRGTKDSISIQKFHEEWEKQHDTEVKESNTFLVKDGNFVSVNSEVAERLIAQGYKEQRTQDIDNKRTIQISNGEVSFRVRPSEVAKFEAIGFEAHTTKKCKKSKFGKIYRITNGVYVEKVCENHLKYYEQVGYHVIGEVKSSGEVF